ncbi:MAG: AAA family ATPase [Actinomycetota bacterium]|nr:AAA family ATPase [Actinomycetota bacterium]
MLHGRDAERARVAALLGDACAGKAGALLIRGEAGVGKSALLQDAVTGAAGMRVLAAQGLESEAPMAFAGLHQLVRPVLSLLERLPAPQARALRVAFGLQDGPSEDPFLVALATLSMLSEAADSTPLLCVVDDAHWLDTASADALLFAARRLQADPVALIFAARDADVRTFTAEGVPTLVLTGLDAPAARLLLAEHTGASLPDHVAQALLTQTGGNPLALVELPTSLTSAQLDGTASIPGQLRLTDRVQRVFLDRCRRLPNEVQTLLLVAAADDTASLSVLTRAAGLLGVSAAALPDAERAGLLVTDRDTVRVRHPLVRSAVYQAATGHERRAAHRALATVLTGQADRQAWHRAAAADGPDGDVVAALAAAGDRAERRGGYGAAAAAFGRASELCAGDQERAAMLFAAARNAWASGQADRARAQAQAARDGADDRILRADIDRLLGRIEVNVGSAATAFQIFNSAARAVVTDDPARAVELWVAATLTHTFDADTGVGPAEEIPPSVLEGQREDVPRTRCLKLLLAATIADNSGAWAQALRSLHAAADASTHVADLDVLGNLGNAALHLGDDQTHRSCFTRMLAGARENGAVMVILYALPRLAFAHLLSGDWSTVRSAADEALALSADTGQPALGAAPIGWLTLLAALQGHGDYDMRRTLLDDTLEQRHLGVLTDPVHDMSQWAAGVRAANDGDAVGALRHLARMRLPPFARMVAIDRIEAAVRAGEGEQAQAWLDDLATFAEKTRWPWAFAAADYGRALLADPADAPALFDSALAHHEHSGRPYDRARTHLAYGELLRRTQRRGAARPHLRAALVIFEELRAEPLISRTEQELRATGETARKRDPSTLTLLTPTELRVAQLVARGLSNKDAAAECWISPRTVAFHLRNVFSKTGITSRGELAQLGLAASSLDQLTPAPVR